MLTQVPNTANIRANTTSNQIVSKGNTYRLMRVMMKAKRGERVVIGIIGGSITQGAIASHIDNCYASIVAQWWRDTFPQAEIEFVNAGIGATGSSLGCHRVKSHLLRYNPDFVIVEYAVNDSESDRVIETLEGLTRQILKQPNDPAMMLYFSMLRNAESAEDVHTWLGRYYDLPMVSFRNGIQPYVDANLVDLNDIIPDAVHPDDLGHAYAAQFIIEFLEDMLAELPHADLQREYRIPQPMSSDVFEYATMYNRASIVPVRSDGWIPAMAERFGECWESSAPGSTIEFEVSGTVIGVAYYRIKGDTGIAEAQVDDCPPVRLNGWHAGDWGAYTHWNVVADGLPPGKHKLRVTLLSDIPESSNGHLFRIHLVTAAGFGK